MLCSLKASVRPQLSLKRFVRLRSKLEPVIALNVGVTSTLVSDATTGKADAVIVGAIDTLLLITIGLL